MQKDPAKKLAEIDFVRCVCVFSVVMIHVSANYVELLAPGFFMNQWSRFAVPLFLLLSGFLIHYRREDYGSLRRFYRRRFGKVLIPYGLWSVFYFLFTAYTNRLPLNWSALPSALFYGTAYYHLYFMIIILQLYLLYPALKKWLAASARTCLTVSLVTTAVCELTLYLAMFSKLALPNPGSPLYLTAFPSWLGFFVLGMFFSQNYLSWKAWIIERRVKITLIWAVTFALFYLEGQILGSYRSSIRIMTIPYTCTSGLWLLSLALHFHPPAIFERAYTWAAAQGFLIYLLHPAALTELLRHGEWLIPGAGISHFILLYLATAGITAAAAAVLQRLPGITWLGGVRR